MANAYLSVIQIILITSLVLATQAQLPTNSCSMTQSCWYDTQGSGNLSCTAPEPAVFANVSGTRLYEWNSSNNAAPACPEFIGQQVCCNVWQDTQEYVNFILLQGSFGHQNGGCDVCAANLRRFWCYFTCAANQAQFLQIGEMVNVIQPSTGMSYYARAVNMTINADMACELFTSCSKTQFITLLSQTSTSQGFLTFLGQNGVSTGQVWITMNLNYDPNALNFEIDSCSANFSNGTNQWNYPVNQTCNCNTCSAMCASQTVVQVGQLTDGFSLTIVGVAYALGVGIVVITEAYRRLKKYRKTNNSGVQPGEGESLISRSSD
jgi:hypothetical protein